VAGDITIPAEFNEVSFAEIPKVAPGFCLVFQYIFVKNIEIVPVGC
jgi:hypothetical protein